MKLLVRDAHARMNNDQTTTAMPSGGMDVVNADGRTLYRIHILPNGNIQIYTGDICKQDGRLLGDWLIVYPLASNTVYIGRAEHGTSPTPH